MVVDDYLEAKIDKCLNCSDEVYKRRGNPQWYHMSTRDVECVGKDTIAVPFHCTRKRRKKIEEYGAIFDTGDIHGIWNEFVRKFMVYKNWDPYKIKFKWNGYKLMKKVRKWSKKYPNDIKIVTCDDAIYTSSCMVLIAHRTTTYWHGITCISIPQLTGKPNIMFWYDKHTKNLSVAVAELEDSVPNVEDNAD
jgi:hypothetical protein